MLPDAKASVRAVEFAPHQIGLKLATISTDNQLRIYECLEPSTLASWQLIEEVDVTNLPTTPSPSYFSRAHTVALATPTQTTATLDGTSVSQVTQALQQNLQQGALQLRPGVGNREADGGWCISWCKDRYWGEVIAAGCGTNGIVKIIQVTPSRRPMTILSLDPTPPTEASSSNVPQLTQIFSQSESASTTTPSSNITAATEAAALTSGATPSNLPTTSGGSPSIPPTTTAVPPNGSTGGGTSTSTGANTGTGTKDASSTDPATGPASFAVTSVAWAPSCGRSYHLIATGGRDGHVRIWRVRPSLDEDSEPPYYDELGKGEGENDDSGNRWSASIVADFDHHRSTVARVEWNITGTVLSSAGNDGRIRLWKATMGNVWRPAGSIGVEQEDERERQQADAGKDIDMA
ncbi:hypothetical protein AX17_004892 [Amanita inopinata Kibby_2008]|nr:hypothetical protein AX17_004892 [Amanita inopinata Kibby_2008]